jgi:hypothetical protein
MLGKSDMFGRTLLLGLVLLTICAPSLLLADPFHGYECTDDCSGHEAGYAWAEREDVTNPNDCDGNSQSFIEGCEAWTNENSSDPSIDDPEKTPDDSSDQ